MAKIVKKGAICYPYDFPNTEGHEHAYAESDTIEITKDIENELVEKVKLIIWAAEHQRYPELSVPFDHHGTVDDASWDRERERITNLAKKTVSTCLETLGEL
jgi:hypothetical protein